MTNPLSDAPIPQWFSLELSSHCNLKCPFCATGCGAIPMAGRGNISDADFHTIFEKIRPHAEVIQLYNWGEPFLHKRLYHYIETIATAGIDTQISSNLSVRLFDTNELERLVRSGLSALHASIDGVTQEAYEAYRKNGKVAVALENLKNIQETKERLGSETPHLIWAYYLNRHNQHEIGRARYWARRYGVTLWFKELSCPEDFQTTFLGHRPELFNTPDNLSRVWRGRRNKHIGPLKLDPRLPKVCNVCQQPFEMMVINFNGDVFPCTTVTEKKFVVGNLVNESLEDIWQNKMRLNRQQLLDVDRIRAQAQCSACPHFPKAHPPPAKDTTPTKEMAPILG